jgi:hypothetical protein
MDENYPVGRFKDQDMSDIIVFSAYIVQCEGQIVGWENDAVAYEHDLI